jgi:CHAD domain-containing protein
MQAVTDKEIFSEDLAIAETLGRISRAADDEEIHQARVLIKRLRARLQLLIDLKVPGENIDAILVNLRQFSKGLSGKRDLDVMFQKLGAIELKYRSKKINRIINELRGYYRVTVKQDKMPVEPFNVLSMSITRGIISLHNIVIPPADIHEYVNAKLSSACDKGKKALKTEKCKKLHAWRKQIKTIFYQMEIITPTTAEQQQQLKWLDKLGKRLGSVHDYCFIEHKIHSYVTNEDVALNPQALLKVMKKEKRNQLKKCRNLHKKLCG